MEDGAWILFVFLAGAVARVVLDYFLPASVDGIPVLSLGTTGSLTPASLCPPYQLFIHIDSVSEHSLL